MNDDPRIDPIGTVREHADGSRAVKVTETDGDALVWCSVSALLGVVWMTHEDLAEEWPVRSPSRGGQVRVFRYTKSNFKPVEQLPVYRVYPDGCVTRQQHGDVERGSGHELDFLEHEVLHGRMAETAEPLPGGGRS